jgi:hypothetical protein
MKRMLFVIWFCSLLMVSHGQAVQVEFCGETLSVPSPSISQTQVSHLSSAEIDHFFQESNNWSALGKAIRTYRDQLQLNDWFQYQLIRRIAQELTPKSSNYDRYTLMKGWLLAQMGFQPLFRRSKDHLLLYVQSEDQVFNIPSRTIQGKTYICLNYHDYQEIDFGKTDFEDFYLNARSETGKSFSYQINHLPLLPTRQYQEKKLTFVYHTKSLEISIRVNPEMNRLLNNYPAMDYAAYFNIPMSAETYNSLVVPLKKVLSDMTQQEGIDYLMRFTRWAFAFESDQKQFGGEKRLAPEQTLLYNQSDCDDRAALFYYLVKEIYNLPMIVLTYPEHVTVAVELKHGKGKPILYEGRKYYICEPTPQRIDLGIGDMLPEWKKQVYEIAYAYQPNSPH